MPERKHRTLLRKRLLLWRHSANRPQPSGTTARREDRQRKVAQGSRSHTRPLVRRPHAKAGVTRPTGRTTLLSFYTLVGVCTKNTLRSASLRSSPGQLTVARSSVSLAACCEVTNRSWAWRASRA